ncbi:hypothetical protein EDD17DRAFT_1511573 [Pisolithus thermaeus]|nr:hypothetical protein EV401DRAFT_1885893 [Pisolithus croceorrhizus]KAI6159104.1 hypothetical protein EDD17DRAFT_1511573 [Pisolithus thermaeus]
MFVKNSLALQDTVNCILTIFKMLIVNSGGLDKAEKLEQWRNAVRDIQWELLIRVLLLQESVRSIANRTDNILHMLIGMDKYVHWMENIGMPGIPFPDWHQALFPPIESIADHPWLLTVEWQYNVGLQVQPLAPTTEACLTWLPRGQQAIYQCEALHWVKVKPEPPQKERWPWQKRLQYLVRTTTGTRVKTSRRISKWMTSSLRVDNPKNEEGRHPNHVNPLECLSHDHE